MEVYAEHIKIAFGEPGRDFTHIVGLESKGFVLGPILALQWGLAFVPLRKKGKLPGECFSQDY
jgi:adenine phosphoribosyltransferase